MIAELNNLNFQVVFQPIESRPRDPRSDNGGNVNAGFKAEGSSNGKADKGGKDVERGDNSQEPQQQQSPQQSNGSAASGPRSLTGGTRV